MAAFHRLNIAAEFLIELIHEDERAIRFSPASRNPLVPAGHHDERRLEFKCALPLFLKVVSLIYSVRPGVLHAVMKTAPARFTRAHVSHFAVSLPKILRDRNIHLLRFV